MYKSELDKQNQIVLRSFPINQPVSYSHLHQYGRSDAYGIVVGYSLNGLGEIILKIKLIQDDDEDVISNVHPYSFETNVEIIK